MTERAAENGTSYDEEVQKFVRDWRIPAGKFGDPDDLGAFHVWNNVPEQTTAVFKDGKQVFSMFIETELEFSEDDPEAGPARDGVVAKLLAKFKRLSGRQETGEKFAAEMTEAMQEAGNAMEALDGKVSKFGTEQQDLRKKLEEHLEAFAKFREKVEKTDSNPNKRPLNTGGAGYEKADC